MDKVRKIHELENEMIDSMKELYIKAFAPALGYRAEYYIGEEEGTQREVIVFELTSRMLGNIYRKSMRIPEGHVYEEYENDFISKIMTDFIMLGTTFLTNSIMASRAAQHNDADGILVKPFSGGRLNKINPN